MPHIDLIKQSPSENFAGHADTLIRQTPNRRLAVSRLNAPLICVVLGGTLFQLFAMPFLLRAHGIAAALFVLPIMLLQPLHWGLIHEAVHSRLLRNRRADDFWARLLSITHWLPFDATRFCHLVHHRYSRHAYDQPDVFDGRGSYALAWLQYRGRLFGGLYLGLLVSPLIAFLPVRLRERVMQDAVPIEEAGDTEVRRLFVSLVRNVRKQRRTQREFVLTLALYGTSAWVYGEWWPILLASMYLRGLWHSLADNVAHHNVALDEPERARNYALPRLFRVLMMNSHLHLTHHRHPTAPWSALHRMSGIGQEKQHENYFRAALRQFASCYPRASSS